MSRANSTSRKSPLSEPSRLPKDGTFGSDAPLERLERPARTGDPGVGVAGSVSAFRGLVMTRLLNDGHAAPTATAEIGAIGATGSELASALGCVLQSSTAALTTASAPSPLSFGVSAHLFASQPLSISCKMPTSPGTSKRLAPTRSMSGSSEVTTPSVYTNSQPGAVSRYFHMPAIWGKRCCQPHKEEHA